MKKRLNTKCGHFNLNENCEECCHLKKQWDAKLKKNGFEDAEKNELLKKWSGSSLEFTFVDKGRSEIVFTTLFSVIPHQEPLQSIQSSWPEPNFSIENDLLNHPEFKDICKVLCKHGNSTITPKKTALIWRSYCEGVSLRNIGIKFDVDHVTIYRMIKKLRELSKLWK